MSNVIHLLSDETINQIAAGEVIESPSSVVKELIENALDANASKITVEVLGGGMKLVRITDDGKGMGVEDARLCILRHATSKIKGAGDLFHIATKGFRGEALSSIASISSMTLTTAQQEGQGIQLEIERGAIVKEKKVARLRGTTFEIRSLFYNVPARKKFQKNPAAIAAEIFRIVTVMSLAHPDVSFELITNGRKGISTLGATTLDERAKLLLGDEFVGQSFPLAFCEDQWHFYGMIGSPLHTRANRTSQYLFINKRAVSCPEVNEAIYEAYATRLEQKRHPLFLLHLDIPPSWVDINVHPQKLHVRLKDPLLLCEKVQLAVEKALVKTKKSFVSISQKPFEPSPFVEKTYQPQVLQEEVVEQELQFDPIEGEAMGVIGSYLFVKEDPELKIVDLRAAQARILFERLLEKGSRGGEKQGLLLPLTVELAPIEIAMVLTHQEAIEKVGFSFALSSQNTLRIDALPPFIDEGEVAVFLSQLAHQLQEYIGKEDYEKEREKKLASMTLRYAKFRGHFSKEEGLSLYKQLKRCESPLFCPNGKPTFVSLDHDAIQELITQNRKTTKSPSE